MSKLGDGGRAAARLSTAAPEVLRERARAARVAARALLGHLDTPPLKEGQQREIERVGHQKPLLSAAVLEKGRSYSRSNPGEPVWPCPEGS